MRSLIRRVVLFRAEQDVVEAKVVWVSGAYLVLRVQPAVLHRTSQLGNYEELVGRILELAGEGHQDTEIARRLPKEKARAALADRKPAFVREDRGVLERSRAR